MLNIGNSAYMLCLCLTLIVVNLNGGVADTYNGGVADTYYDEEYKDIYYLDENENDDEAYSMNHWHPLILEEPAAVNSINSLYQMIQKFYLPVPRRINNTNCKNVVNKFLVNLLQGVHSWALKMGDSWGKVPDGFLFGNIHTLGMYEECLMVEDSVRTIGNEVLPFKGKYCLIYYNSPNYTIGLPSGHNNDNEMVRSGPAMALILQPLPFYYATCIPSVCTSEDLTTSINVTLQEMGRNLTTVICTDEDELSLDGFDKFVLILISFLLCMVVIGTICDSFCLAEFEFVTCRCQTITKVIEILRCFSLLKNLKKIMSYQVRESNSEITCMHGIRAITLIWITTCHQYEITIKFSVNTANADKYQDPLLGQLITNGYPGVDTFFCLSGILVAYRLFAPTMKKDFFCYVKAFIRRIIRLAPTIFLVSVFCATLLRFLGWGPRNHYLQKFSHNVCRNNWWKDPLFVDNFEMEGNHGYTIDDCLSQCWYTAVDMQLFIITPLLLIPFAFNTFIGVAWLGAVTVGALLIPPGIIYKNDFPPIPIPYMSLQKHLDFEAKFYGAPWCRAVPWIIGLWVGIFMVKKPANLPKPNYFFIFIGYVIAIVVGLLTVMGLYHYNHVGAHDHLELWMSVIYVAFSKPGWALAVCFVVVTCDAGYAGVVNKFLSWLGWRPLSRLTFCMYVITPIVQLWWTTVLFLPTYYSYLYKLFEICGVYFISFIMSVIVSCLIERPLLSLSNMLFTTSLHKPPSIDSNISTKKLCEEQELDQEFEQEHAQKLE